MLPYISLIVILIVAFFIYEFWRYKSSDHGAPYVPLDNDLVERILEISKVGENDVVYDLGSGDGRISIMAALKHNARSVGIEIDTFRYWYSLYQVWVLRLGNKVKFIRGDLFAVDFSPATVVTMYLLQETNEKLMNKLKAELKPGTRIVSCAFNLPGWKPIFIDKDHRTPFGPIYLYVMGVSDKTSGISNESPEVNSSMNHAETKSAVL